MSSDPKPPSSGGDGGEDGAKDAVVAKTAGFFVFSGIAMSIIKALTSKAPQPQQPPPSVPPTPPLQDSSKKPAVEERLECGSSSARTIEIVRGDTLWGLSRKYGVSIDAIKEANGITGDTIYAGKKLQCHGSKPDCMRPKLWKCKRIQWTPYACKNCSSASPVKVHNQSN